MSPIIQSIFKIITLVYNWPRKINDLIPYAKAKYNKMTGNPRYAALAAKLTELKDAIKALEDEQALCTAKPPQGNIDTRDTYAETVKRIIRDLGGSVQAMANADLPNAETIITDANFDVKGSGGGHPLTNTIEDGPVSGSVTVTAAGKGPHLWRTSYDNVSFTIRTGSKKSTINLYGLTLKETIYVQNGKVTDDGSEPSWSQSVYIVVR
jgi:hypothetical protein